MLQGTVIVLALYALLETVISLLFSAALWISSAIMNGSITVFSSGQNVIQTFVNFLLSAGEGDVAGSFPIGNIIDSIAYGLLGLLLITAVIKSFSGQISGEEATSPWQVVIDVIIAVFLKNLIFGTSFFVNFGGLLGTIGEWFGSILSQLAGEIDISAWEGTMVAFSANPVAYIGLLILTASLLGSVIGAAISYIERILSFALTILLGPIAISLYACKETRDTAKAWILSIFTQFIAVFMNLFLWALFLKQLASLQTVTLDFTGSEVAALIFRLSISIAILSIIKNCEKILNSFNLRTINNLDSARAVAGGVAALGSAALMGTRLGPSFEHFLSNGMHGNMPPAQGGKGGHVNGNPAMPYTGNASLYNENGSLSIDSSGNSFRRGMANLGGNWSSSYIGAGSAKAAQNRQAQAISAINKQLENANDGDLLAGASFSDNVVGSRNEQAYSPVQMVNTALTGSKDGYGSTFSAIEGKNAPEIATVQTANGKESSGLMVYGGIRKPDGVIGNTGSYFVPVTNGGSDNPIAIGTTIGDNLYFSGDSVQIDESGSMAYKLDPVPENMFASPTAAESFGENSAPVEVASIEFTPEDFTNSDIFDGE